MKWLLILPLLAFASTSQASEYDELMECLNAWGKHPFNTKKLDYKTVGKNIKVLGIGKDNGDSEVTKTPRLVFVRPSVAVLSKNVIKLQNPNGWYCLKAKVDVLAKTEIELACKAKLAVSSGDDTTVLGGTEGADKGTGVTVLGKTVVKRTGCK